MKVSYFLISIFFFILTLNTVISNANLLDSSYSNESHDSNFEISKLSQDEKDQHFMKLAINQAIEGLNQGGIPIGSIVVLNDKILGQGHNMRVQTGSPIQHGEMNALDNAGRLTADVYRNATLYTTLSPCQMCSATINLYKIPRVVIGENKNFKDFWGEEFLQQLGHEVKVLDNDQAYQILKKYITENPDTWNEDIGKKTHNHIHSQEVNLFQKQKRKMNKVDSEDKEPNSDRSIVNNKSIIPLLEVNDETKLENENFNHETRLLEVQNNELRVNLINKFKNSIESNNLEDNKNTNAKHEEEKKKIEALEDAKDLNSWLEVKTDSAVKLDEKINSANDNIISDSSNLRSKKKSEKKSYVVVISIFLVLLFFVYMLNLKK